jgi:hypothetical protein
MWMGIVLCLRSLVCFYVSKKQQVRQDGFYTRHRVPRKKFEPQAERSEYTSPYPRRQRGRKEQRQDEMLHAPMPTRTRYRRNKTVYCIQRCGGLEQSIRYAGSAAAAAIVSSLLLQWRLLRTRVCRSFTVTERRLSGTTIVATRSPSLSPL